MPITLNHSNINVQYETGKNYNIETVKSDLYLIDSRVGISSNLTAEPVVTSATFTETIRTFVHNGSAEAQTTYNITVAQNTICDILIVAGGGAGGNDRGGGGGGGGIIYSQNIILNGGTYIINVGKEGIGSTSGTNGGTGTRGSNGGNSSISGPNLATLTAIGGGAGGSCASGGIRDGLSGGSGGGGSQYGGNGSGGSGTSGQGNNGGSGIEYGAAGGGGGFTTAGGNASSTQAGNGGQGLTNSITGTSVTYSAGGGGGGSGGAGTGLGQQTAGSGGSSGAGNGGLNNSNGSNATVFGCGGGGGGSSVSVATKGGNGGSGIVIIKFKTIVGAAVSEGNPTTTHKRLNFTYSPNYSFIQADTTNLKAWYKFDDNFDDSSGNNSHLTIHQGTPTLSTTQFKIGKSSFINNSILKTTGFTFHNKAFSIACWVYQTEYGFILSQPKANASNQALHLQFHNTYGYRFGFYGNDLDSGSIYNSDTNIWVHLVFQIDTNRNREIWRNGVRIANDTSTSFLNTDNNTIYVGEWVSGGVNDNFGGYIDDMRFYDRALTSAEISQLYTIPLQTDNTYTLNFPVSTFTDINNNSNIVLRGAYDISLSTSNSLIIPKNNQYIPKPTTFTNYSVERMYPPVRNFTAATTTVSGQTYGNGTYVVSFSATYGNSVDPWTCFNTANANGGAWPDNRYSSGVFTSTSFIVAGYLGDWLKIQLPVAIKLTRFEILMRTNESQQTRERSPKDFIIYGSNDNITWVELVNKTDAVYNASYKYEQTTPEIKNTYSYYALVVNKIISTVAVLLNFDEWYIYGQEVLPSSLSLRYHLLNPILDPTGAQWTYSSNNTNVYHMGSVGIGTTSPEYHLDVRGNIYSSLGGFTQSGLTSWSITSDRRIKENIVKASYEKCLENVKNIELYNFNFKDNYVNTNDRRQLGFIAQEVQQVYPKAVEVSKMILNLEEKIDDLLTLNTTQIDYTLYGAVKGLIHKMENIKIKMEQIKSTSNITILT